MSKGAPDYTKMTLLQALDGNGDLIPVLLDSTGKIIAILQGTDGSALRTIKVDTSGQLITLIKGSAGESISVDGSGNLSAAMKGIDGATLRTVAVDSSGNILGVLKGDYQGDLKTLATDADGKLLAKIYDPANVWGNPQSIGFAELAQRMGIPYLYDKRGEVIWYDDFQNGVILWGVSTSGTGAAAAADTTVARRGKQSAKLTAGTSSTTSVELQHLESYLGPMKVGAQITFSVPATYTPLSLDVTLILLGAGHNLQGKIRVDFANSALKYYNNVGVYTTFATPINIFTGSYMWNSLKFVVDFSTLKYIRCMFQGTKYDLSANAIHDLAAGNDYYFGIFVKVNGDVNSNKYLWIDSAILTGNEP